MKYICYQDYYYSSVSTYTMNLPLRIAVCFLPPSLPSFHLIGQTEVERGMGDRGRQVGSRGLNSSPWTWPFIFQKQNTIKQSMYQKEKKKDLQFHNLICLLSVLFCPLSKGKISPIFIWFKIIIVGNLQPQVSDMHPMMFGDHDSYLFYH